MLHRIFNAGNVSGTIAFLALLAVPGAVDGEKYITAVVLVAVFAACARISVREDEYKENAPAPEGIRGRDRNG